MSIRGAAFALAVAGLLAGAAPALADLSDLEGHLTFGYAKLFVDHAPGGSLSVAAGLDLPVTASVRAGLGLGFSLLGTRNVNSGSLTANVDYTVFEALAYGHWLPRQWGPVDRVSLGAGLMNSRAEISSAGGGAAFTMLAREQVAPALGIDATLMPHGPRPLRAGIELGAHFGFLDQETWTVAAARFAVYY